MRRDDFERERRLYWKRTICRDPCARCGETDALKLEGHHVIEKRTLKQLLSGTELFQRLWDERGGMALCQDCHAKHTSRSDPVPFELLTEDHKAFAEELGLSWLLERTYPDHGTSRRTSARA